MDINTLSIIVFGVLFLLLVWGTRKVLNLILEMTTDIGDRYEQLVRDMKRQQEDLLKLKSEVIAMEYYKQKPHREPRHARNDVKYENEVEKDGGNP